MVGEERMINMEVLVKLFATFREGRFSSKKMKFTQGTTVGDVVKELNINEREISIIMINGQSSDLDAELSDGDTLGLFPPVGGG